VSGPADLTSRTAVIEAIGEWDQIGRARFLSLHGYGPARWFFAQYRSRLYDSKALVGVAIGYQLGQPLRAYDWTGGEATAIRALRRLGFDVVDARAAPIEGRVQPFLRPKHTYSWAELSSLFGCSPGYFSVAGGMLPLRAMNVLLLISYLGGAKSFDYGDEWDGDELIYTGRGLEGPQKLEGANLDVAENRRPLYVFEHADTGRLAFVGYGRCIDWMPDFAPDRRGRLRRVYRFRLAFADDVPEAPRPPRLAKSAPAREPPAVLRRARPFDPAKSPGSYRIRADSRARPEETAALQEKATTAHHAILVALSQKLEDVRWSSIEEVPAAIDLRATSPSGTRTLFEAKTLSARNEAHQVRNGLAQLLEYRFLYGDETDLLCLVTSRPIRDDRIRFLRALGIDVMWVDSTGMRTRGGAITEAVGEMTSVFDF
jgi:hypothetical protein